MSNIQKAEDFYEIQDAVSFNTPVDEKHLFYTDFSNFRNDFKEKTLYRHLNININTKKCNPFKDKYKKIFLSGYKGTGKTSELLKLTNAINKTNCYFSIFVNIADEELDTNNIETVDVLILMLEKLVKQLKDKDIDIDTSIIASFYKWYETRIVEINKNDKSTGTIEFEANAKVSLLGLFGIVSKTKAQLQASTGTKEIIRQTFNNKFSDFSLKFNEFILSIKNKFHQEDSYKDILFILDGFEKIGTYESKRKILLDDANKFTNIKSHIITTLPIELFSEKNHLNNFSSTINFPLIDLNIDGAKEQFKVFILKRISEALFADDLVIDKIIEYGAGHPRQTLQIINRAYIEAEDDIIDLQSVENAIKILSSEMSELNKDEILVLKEIQANAYPTISPAYIGLKAKNIIFDYGALDEKEKINPIILENEKLKKQMNTINA